MAEEMFTDRVKDHNKKGAWGWSIFQMTKGRCAYCGKALDFQGLWHLDHVIPRCQGGPWKDNLVPSCPNCNASKGPLTPDQWRDRIPRRLITDIKRAWPRFGELLPLLPEEDARFIEYRFADILHCLENTRAVFCTDRLED